MFSGSDIAEPTEGALEKTDNTVVQSSPEADTVQKKQEARRLPAVLGMKDLTTFLVLIVVYIPLVSSVQLGGPAAFLYWAFGFLAFLIPTAFVTRWLAREIELRHQLQDAYNEQEILVQQQHELLLEVDRLYHEHAQAAVTDAITGLANHRAIMSKIEEELAHCQQTQSSCAILFVDLDHFKQINDTWGHRAGDVVLHEIGNRLRFNIRAEDFVGRYGGEEFAVVLAASGSEAAVQAAERMRLAIASNACFWEAEDTQQLIPIAVTASIGVAVYQQHGITREALIEAADRAMYLAKHTGRNRVCLADDENDLSFPPNGTVVITNGTGVINHAPTSIEAVGIQALTAAAMAHDRGTGDHSQRMVRFAESTARKLKVPEGEIYLIRLAALLHDIGKIGIPDAILHKPGPLTDEEWEIMRLHPAIGRQILEQIGGIFEYLASIVVAHHERWDGRGYPHGLAREAIPLSARILSVVDSYDAMTSRRPYRELLSTAEARAELQRCAGSQFDSKVVKAFLEVLDEQENKEETRLMEDLLEYKASTI